MNPANLDSMFFNGLSFLPSWLTSDAVEQSRQSACRSLVSFTGRCFRTRRGRFNAFVVVLILTPYFLWYSLPFYSIHRLKRQVLSHNNLKLPIRRTSGQLYRLPKWRKKTYLSQFPYVKFQSPSSNRKIGTELWKITTEPWAFWAIVKCSSKCECLISDQNP